MYEFLPTPSKKNGSENFGYTLIELLLVMVIIAIVFSFGTANYKNFQKRQALEAATRNVMGDLRLAQEFALAGKVDDPATCTNFEGYVFARADPPTTNKYYIYKRCNGTNTEYKSVTLQSGVTIAVRGRNGGHREFTFMPLGKGLDINFGSPRQSYGCVGITQGTVSKYIRVDSVNGRIEEIAASCI